MLFRSVRHIDATYRTIARPEARAIGGHSMGAWGALRAAFTHPDVFGVVGAHSPSLRYPEDPAPGLGSDLDYAVRDPMWLARNLAGLNQLRIWVDVGADDHWHFRVIEFHQALQEREIPHVWNMFPGMHLPGYWAEHVLDYLRFYSEAMPRQVTEVLPTPIAAP